MHDTAALYGRFLPLSELKRLAFGLAFFLETTCMFDLEITDIIEEGRTVA